MKVTKQTAKTVGKKVTAIFLMPLLVYLVMLIVCGANGTVFNIFSGPAISDILKRTSYMAIVAMGIGFQLKYGRFDFCGGAVIVASATIGGVFINAVGLGYTPVAGWLVMLIICVLFAVILSVINALAYGWLRIPISVISLAMAYLFESIPGLVLNGKQGPNISYRTEFNVLGQFPLVLIPLAIAIILYVCYDKFTVHGRQSALLRNNQSAAVNIGINEKKNTVICYIVSGILFGLAGAIYATQNTLEPITSPLGTSGTLFSNIVPSLVGLFLSRYINDSAGTFIGALSITILYYGLELVGVGGGLKTVCYAAFLTIFIFISGFWDQIWIYLKKLVAMIKAKLSKPKGVANS